MGHAMKRLVTLCIVLMTAFAAHAVVINGPMIVPGSGIIYNLNPQPPIVSNNQVRYASGTAYMDGYGRPKTCNGQLTLDNARGTRRITCNELRTVAEPLSSSLADDLANLAPAAGGPTRSKSFFRDANLSSDSNTALRTDNHTN
jgi:hypothetical protein